MGNYATRRSSRKRDNWYYFDQLPPRLRQELSSAAFVWDAKWFYDNWNKGKSVDWCIGEIKRWDLHNAYEDVKWREGFKWKKVTSASKETKVRPLYR